MFEQLRTDSDWEVVAYNRYSYANCNPISYVDPDGNHPVLIAMVIGAAISALTYTAQAAFSPGGLQRNFNVGDFVGATITGAAIGGVTAGVGSYFGPTLKVGAPILNAAGEATGKTVSFGMAFTREAGRAAAHGVLGGFFSYAQGGDAAVGFLSSAFSTFASHGLVMGRVELGDVGGAFFSMGVGAGTSYLQGGNPWIGAGAALMSYTLNQLAHRHLMRYPKGYSETTYDRWDKQLQDHKEESRTLRDYYYNNKGKSYYTLLQGNGEGGMMGSQPSVEWPRYVRHPRMAGVIIDMRHFLAVGRYGEGVGTLVEVGQSMRGWKSGMNYQDFVSNRLGMMFWQQYGNQVLMNPYKATEYISGFLLDHRNMFK